MDLGLDGKVFIVTGGTAGLGFATAQALGLAHDWAVQVIRST